MKIFVQKPLLFHGIYRAYLFAGNQSLVSSSTISNEDAVKQLREEIDKIPDGMEDLLEEYKEK